ncbi:hypothetical protein A2U01_0115266, partial [Trifolium medium]|nr:hypothetical protein [Trifolium medium]
SAAKLVFCNLRAAQGILARCAILRTTNRSLFGRMRVAQSIRRDTPAPIFEEIKAFQDGTGVYKRSTS